MQYYASLKNIVTVYNYFALALYSKMWILSFRDTKDCRFFKSKTYLANTCRVRNKIPTCRVRNKIQAVVLVLIWLSFSHHTCDHWYSGSRQESYDTVNNVRITYIRLSRWAGLFILYIHLRAWKRPGISRIPSSYRRYSTCVFFYLKSLPEEWIAKTRTLAYIDNFAM